MAEDKHFLSASAKFLEYQIKYLTAKRIALSVSQDRNNLDEIQTVCKRLRYRSVSCISSGNSVELNVVRATQKASDT